LIYGIAGIDVILLICDAVQPDRCGGQHIANGFGRRATIFFLSLISQERSAQGSVEQGILTLAFDQDGSGIDGHLIETNSIAPKATSRDGTKNPHLVSKVGTKMSVKKMRLSKPSVLKASRLYFPLRRISHN
jgi:hypothetical protein